MSSTAMSFSVPCIEVPRMLLTFETVLASTACFTVIVLAAALLTHHHGPVPLAARAMRWNNQIYAVASVVMLGLMLQFIVGSYGEYGYMPTSAASEDRVGVTSSSSVRVKHSSSTENTIDQDNQTALVALAPLLYHCSKFYEYLDIIFVLANHGPSYRSLSQQPVGLHFGFHHFTTPYLTWFRIIQSHSPGWEVFAGLNCLHHAIMYSFFSGRLKIIGLEPVALRKILPWTGGLQLVVGIVMEAKALIADPNNMFPESFDDNLLGHWVALGLLSSYLTLYIRDLRQRDEEKTAKTAQRKLD